MEFASYNFDTLIKNNSLKESINSDLGFDPGEVILITATSGSGKSIFLQHLVLSIILNKPYLGQEGNNDDRPDNLPEKDHSVLWIDFDNYGQIRFTESINKFFSNNIDPIYKTPFNSNEYKITKNISYMNNATIKTDDKIISFKLSIKDHESTNVTKTSIIKRAKGKSIIVIDSLIGSTDADENSSSEMNTVLNHLSEIAKETNTVIFVIHHASDKSEHKYRGASSIKGSVGEMFYLSFENTENGREIILETIKSRVGNEGIKYGFLSKPFNYIIPKNSRSIGRIKKNASNYDFRLTYIEDSNTRYNFNGNELIDSTNLASKQNLNKLLENKDEMISYLIESGFNGKITASSIQIHLKEKGYKMQNGMIKSEFAKEIKDSWK